MPTIRALLFLLVLQWLGIDAASAHPGKLDGNGCHYDTASGRYHRHRTVKPNPDVKAPVKKSRENVCHDGNSPNYNTLTMPACQTSGGRAPR
jgi:hypothetical protein